MPDALTAFRPVGHKDDSIIIPLVTHPYRETKVVTRLQQEPNSLILNHNTTIARNIMFVFATISKKMVLVVIILPSPSNTATLPHTAHSRLPAKVFIHSSGADEHTSQGDAVSKPVAHISGNT